MKKIILAVMANRFVLFLLVFPSLLFAQNPSGKEIASAAKNYRELKQFKKTDLLNGKKIRFTPVELTDSTKKSGNGFLIGILENDIAGDETGLPPGRYNLYFAQVKGTPHIYAESNGVIVKEALRVSVDEAGDQKEKNPKITFIPKGWGYYVLIPSSYYNSYYSVYGSSTGGQSCTICNISLYF